MKLLRRAVARIPVLGPSLQRAYWRRLEQRVVEPLVSAVDVSQGEIDVEFLRSLGYDFDPVERRASARRMTDGGLKPAAPQFPQDPLFFVTVCTMNHVPFARTLIESVVRSHGNVAFVVAVVDAPTRDAVAIDGAVIITGRDIFQGELDYLALKYDASQLCCAGKAYAIDYLLLHSKAQKIIYLDSDIYVFAPVDAMIAKLDDFDFVVTPHVVEPFPVTEKFWQKPSLGALMGAGVYNAGMFGMRRSADALKFLETLKWLVIAPGTFVDSQGGQAEQHMFNWITCFADSVAILRDTAYNVGYWNLHDRAFRHLGGEQWTIDQKPLVAFHYSGYSFARPFDLSHHQNRYSFFDFPALARIRDFYVSRVEENNRGELGTAYGFGAFPSGIRIDGIMREIFRNEEVFLRADMSPWTPEGEAFYCRALLQPVPSTSSLVPILVKRLQELRPDLGRFGDVSLNPRPLLEWMLAGGVQDHAYEALFDRYRPVVPTHHGAMLLSAIRKKWPRLFEGLKAPLREDRRAFLARLQEVAPYEANQILIGAGERYLVSPVRAIRELYDARADLREAFPDVLFDDGAAFAQWLREHRLKEHFLPAEAIELFAERANGRPLARIFSLFSRTWHFMEPWPLAMVGESKLEFGRALLDIFKYATEYDLHDVEMFLWTMDVKPWAGLPLTLELPIHTMRHPSSRSRAGQQEILEPVLRRDRAFAVALDDYRRRYPPVEDPAPRSQRMSKDVIVFSAIGKPPKKIQPPPRPIPPGANVFGFHRSDTGLGQMTRGLTQALHTIGCPTSDIPLPTSRMDDDLRPEDFIRRYDVAKGTNLFVSVTHLHHLLLRSVPDEVVERHRNIVYLAWEQREGNHYWKDAFAEFDQVWALSDFVADGLTETLQRKVHSVPCVVDLAAFPPPSTKEAHRLDPGVFTFLFIFDASSATERKNPDGAIEAFRRAFGNDDRVRLLIKSSSFADMGGRARLRRLMEKVRGARNIEIRAEDLSRHELYGLFSATDCYVSLHRGEGFGYTCAEAMAYAKPVIATGYSGNMHFMNDENSYLVSYKEVETNVQEGPFHRGSVWAEPDVNHAAELMRRVLEQRDEATARGARGRLTVETMLSPRAVGERVRTLLDGDV
ncbi:MAG TPA: glycosyltransferase family 4 protein [Thermoanaerobaculia bacterium]|nr:glycosyltransferase family 4 protein [Thermoanaerobaculia bacterium]